MRVPGIGSPSRVLNAAAEALTDAGHEVIAMSPFIASRPIGPSLRTYANAAVVLESELDPPAVLASLQTIEARFGRRRRGSAWRARPLDLDIVLWSGEMWCTPDLVIPHPYFRERSFVLVPAADVAPDWRDPVTGLSVRQLNARLRRPASRR